MQNSVAKLEVPLQASGVPSAVRAVRRSARGSATAIRADCGVRGSAPPPVLSSAAGQPLSCVRCVLAVILAGAALTGTAVFDAATRHARLRDVSPALAVTSEGPDSLVPRCDVLSLKDTWLLVQKIK